MSDVDLALGYGNRFDIRGAEGIRNLCLAGEGIEHNMNFVGLVDDPFNAMVLAVLQVFHGEALLMGAASRGEALATGQRDPRRGEGGVGDGTA
jgi:hypothetical protein